MELPIVLHTLGPEIASGAGAAVNLGTVLRTFRVELAVTAVGGTTPSLLVTLETSADGTTGWRTLGTLGPVTIVSVLPAATFIGGDRYVRANFTIAGTLPSVTFSLSGVALSQYASIADLKELGLPGTAFAPPLGMTQAVFDAAVNAQIVAVSGKIDSYLRGKYAVPLTGALGPNSYPPEFRKATTDIEALELLTWRGFNPDQFDEVFVKRSEAAYKWLSDIAKGTAVVDLPPPPPTDPGSAPSPGAAAIATRPRRGW